MDAGTLASPGDVLPREREPVWGAVGVVRCTNRRDEPLKWKHSEVGKKMYAAMDAADALRATVSFQRVIGEVERVVIEAR